MTVTLLLTAAGAAMVGLTVPSMYKSANTAASTFDRQVKVLERGANGGPAAGIPGFESLPGLPAGPAAPLPAPPVFDFGGAGAPGTPATPLTTKSP